MKSKHSHFLLGAILSVLTGTAALAKPDLPNSQARAGILDQGEKLLADPVHQYDTASLVLSNPFVPKQTEKPKVLAKNVRPASDEDFLVILAAKLNPTGVLMLGDQAYLLFGEKKVKVGDPINIPFEKESIEVELIDLTSTSFTLKLNNEQLTRPITPGNSHEKPSS